MSRRLTGSAGFTLLELLVAMTLLGLLFALVGGGLHFGATAWRRGGAAVERTAELETVQNLLRRLIGQADAQWLQTSRGRRAVAFEGAPDGVRFLGPAPARAMRAGVYAYRLSVANLPSGHALVLDWRAFPPDADTLESGEPGEREVLVEGIASVAFDYFGTVDRDEPAWRPDWQAERRLPLLVRVVVAYPPGDARRWPPLVVAVATPEAR